MRGKDLFPDPDILPFMKMDVKVCEGENNSADGVCIVTNTAILLSLLK